MSLPTESRTIVVSPHLDDAALSLGATIAQLSRAGRRVTIVTVFAGDVESERPAGAWDSQVSVHTEGEGARVRRIEDLAACGVLGAKPVWLSFPDQDYAEARKVDNVCKAVREILHVDDDVLLPGFPLANADHRWLAESLLECGLQVARVGLYAEQPYRYWVRRTRPRPETSALASVEGDVRWKGSTWTALRFLVPKWRAVRSYRSQLEPLGLRRSRLAWLLAHEALHGGELVAWDGVTDVKHSCRKIR